MRSPSDIGAKVDFVTTYHMVIEGTLALTGQYFQTDNLERRSILPGHLKAFKLLISRDGGNRPGALGTCSRRLATPSSRSGSQDEPGGDASVRRRCAGPPGLARLGDDYEYLGYSAQTHERVRVHGAVAAAEGDRRRAACGGCVGTPALGPTAPPRTQYAPSGCPRDVPNHPSGLVDPSGAARRPGRRTVCPRSEQENTEPPDPAREIVSDTVAGARRQPSRAAPAPRPVRRR